MMDSATIADIVIDRIGDSRVIVTTTAGEIVVNLHPVVRCVLEVLEEHGLVELEKV